MKWWAQSYLSGVPQITCGFRNDDGICEYVQNFQTMELPAVAEALPNSWNSDICLCFLDNFLQFVKDIFKNITDHRTVCVLTYKVENGFILYQMQDHSADQFLPDWFTKDIFRQ